MKAFVDRVDDLSCQEKHGVIRGLTRKARIRFEDGDNRPKDFSILRAGFAAIEADPYKLFPYSTLDADGYKSLVLIERNPKLLDNDPSWLDITLVYEHLLDGPNQQLIDPASGIIFGKGRCSITQKTTNFFYPFGDHTKGKVQILTAHTFSPKDMGVAGQVLNPDLPYTITQGGEVSIPFPEGNFQCQGVIRTGNPWSVAYTFINAINKDEWLNGPPQTWICSEVQFEILEAYPPGVHVRPLYKFGFEFQYNEDTWNPTVVFNDQRTGRPPADVQPATTGNPALAPDSIAGIINYAVNKYNGKAQPAGFWTVPAIRTVDFNALFGSLFEGFNGPDFL